MSSVIRSSCVAAADARAAFSRRHSCHGPSKKNGFGPPSSSTAVVTASRNQRSWATRITAASSDVSSRSSHSRLSTSRWFVGSSSSSRSGSEERARASEARVSSPPENVSSGRSRSASANPRPRTIDAARSRHAQPPACSSRPCASLYRRSVASAWSPPAIASSSRRSSSSIATRSPAPESEYSRSESPWPRGGRWSCSATRVSFANASSPAWMDVSPTSARRSVVFPAPFGPASASRSPRRSRNETPSKRGSPESSLRSPDAISTAMD